jgi:type I restriction-modification system DNA methylase subunit
MAKTLEAHDKLIREIFEGSYVRGKYRDVILPFTVLRRLDAVLESTKDKVLAQKKFLDQHCIDCPARR